MGTDDLRDEAKVLALTTSLRALIQILRDDDGQMAARAGRLASEFLRDADGVRPEVRDAASAYQREAIFKPTF